MHSRALVCAASIALAVVCAACRSEPPPNVVLVSIDTLRADAVGAYGGPVGTPALDGLAAGGVLFEHAVAPAPETAPSHATLFSGLAVQRHGVVRNGVALPDAAALLAEAFRAAGYATGGFVSSFVLDPRFGWDRGFDTYDAHFPKEGQTVRQRVDFAAGQELEGYDRVAQATNRVAIPWLASAPEPFFLFVHYFDPHAPYAAPRVFTARVPREGAFATADARIAQARREMPGLEARTLGRLIRRYHGEVLYADAVLARLLGALERKGCRDRTLVVVTGDHGEGLGQHGTLDHSPQLYEAQLRVPLILQWPGRLPAGVRLATPTGLVDVAPTLAELAGVDLADDTDGRSLARALRAGDEPEPRPILGRRRRYGTPVSLHRGVKHFVRSGSWKYIRASLDPDELYDLAADPGETRNLLSEQPERAAALAGILETHLAAHPERAVPEPDEAVRRGLEALGYTEPE